MSDGGGRPSEPGCRPFPALVRTVADADALEQALVENLHREDLNALEEAGAYQQLMEDFGLTQEQVAARVGKSRSAVTNTLRLFQLPPSVQKLVAERKLSAGHARALLGSPDRLFQETMARRAVAEELSVRQVEELVREHLAATRRGDRRSGSPRTLGPCGRPGCSSSRSCCPRISTPGCVSRWGPSAGGWWSSSPPSRTSSASTDR